jgi:hypothetical protein
LKQGVEFSPLGFVNLTGAADKTTALTRAAIGTAVFGASAAMLGAGDLTWGEPTNAEQRDRFRAEGKQPYAIRIGGKWVGFGKLPPGVAFPFALTAGIDDAIRNKKMSESTGDAILEGVAKWGQFLGDQSYVKNIGDTLAAFKGDSEKVVQAVSNYPQQVIPLRALTGWLARMTDDKERRVNTDKGFVDKQVQSLMQNYPGLRQKVPTRDYRGEPIPANNPVLNSFSPLRITDDRGVNPLDAELDATKAPAKDPLLSTSQSKELKKITDKRVADAQKQLIQLPEYKNASPEDRRVKLAALSRDITAYEKKRYQSERQIGEYSQNFTGKETKLTKSQQALAGDTNLTKYASAESKSNSPAASTYKDKYEAALAQFNDPKNGYSDVQKVSKQKELKKLYIQKGYEEDVVALHGMSKADMYAYIKNAPNGKELSNKLLAYDKALYDAGLSQYKKYKNGLAPAAKKASKGKKKGKAKKGSFDYKLYGFNSSPLATQKSLRQLLKQATLKA